MAEPRLHAAFQAVSYDHTAGRIDGAVMSSNIFRLAAILNIASVAAIAAADATGRFGTAAEPIIAPKRKPKPAAPQAGPVTDSTPESKRARRRRLARERKGATHE